MFELSVRLIAAGLITLVAGLVDTTVFEVAWRTSLFFAAYSILGYQLECRNLKNPGIAGFIAAADSIVIACLLASVNRLDDFGFLVLGPCAYAAARYGSLPSAMAPLAAASLLAASVGIRGVTPGPLLMAQAGGVLALGLLLNHRRMVVTVNREMDPIEPLASKEPDAYLELRESYRKLKDMYRDLETRNKIDHFCRQLYETRLAQGDAFYQRLGTKLRELVGVDKMAIYTLAQHSNTMVVRAAVGEFPTAIQDAGIEVNLSQAAIVVRERMEEAVRSIIPPEARATTSTVLLHHQGRLIGMLTLGHPNAFRAEEARQNAEDVSPFVAALIVEEARRSAAECRLRETEVLYDIAVTVAGATTPTSMAARIVREMFPVMDVDHLSVFWIDGGESIQAAHAGVGLRFLETMCFAAGPGMQGWLGIGAPELTIFNVADDSRCSTEQSLKLRINSYAVVPIQFNDRPYGYVAAATHRVGGIDLPTVAVLRTVAAEMGQAASRLLLGPEPSGEGLVTASEFQQFVTQSGDGCMVVLETLRKEHLFETFGKPAVDHALRRLALRLRSKLPQGGALCRRANGDFAAFLAGADESFASSWANEITALASMIGLRTPDGRSPIPLAVRARVAQMTQKAPGLIGEVLV